MVDFQLEDIPMTNINSTENIPGPFGSQVPMPPPNVAPFELPENRKFSRISQASFSRFMTESPPGSEGDSVFIRKCFREVFAPEVRAVASLTGKGGQNKNEVKEKLDEKGVNYCQALFTERIKLDEVNSKLQHKDSRSRLNRFRYLLAKVAQVDNSAHNLKVMKQAAANN